MFLSKLKIATGIVLLAVGILAPMSMKRLPIAVFALSCLSAASSGSAPVPGAQEEKVQGSLRVGTEWIGIQYFEHPQQGAKGQDNIRLKIIEREGDRFKAEYWLSAAKEKRGLRLEGTVTKDGITCKATGILAGKGWRKGIFDVTWTGTLKEKEKQIQLFRTHADGAAYQIDLSFDK